MALAALIVALVGCGSTAPGAAAPSSPPSCTTGTCAAGEIQRSLVGLQAKDGAAITKAACKTARANPGGTWSAACTVTESDGTVTTGTGNWFPAKDQVSYEPSGG